MVSSFKFKLDINNFLISRLRNFPIPDIKKNFPDFENHMKKYALHGEPKKLSVFVVFVEFVEVIKKGLVFQDVSKWVFVKRMIKVKSLSFQTEYVLEKKMVFMSSIFGGPMLFR